jgi:uncharacterized LabA/DUF88 family protein
MHKKRTAVFVDGSNLYHVSTRNLKWKVDSSKLIATLLNPIVEQLADAHWYQCNLETSTADSGFLKFLAHQGFVIHSKPIKTLQGPNNELFQKGNMDIEITTDILLNYHQFDKIILITSDGDFAYLIQALRNLGKEIWICSAKDSIAGELRASVGPHIIDLHNLREKLEYVKNVPVLT